MRTPGRERVAPWCLECPNRHSCSLNRGHGVRRIQCYASTNFEGRGSTPTYAKGAGFPNTLSAAKQTAVTSQKGCPSSVGAVYADAAKQTGLISSILNCDSATSAATASSVIHQHYGVDPAIGVPQDLGPSAFATASIAPQYLMVWRAGNKVAITAVDVNLAASTTTSSTVPSPPLTQAQQETLVRAGKPRTRFSASRLFDDVAVEVQVLRCLSIPRPLVRCLLESHCELRRAGVPSQA